MTNKTYTYFWNQFEKSIRTIECLLSAEDKSNWNFERAYGEEYSEVIRASYEAIRDQLKERCYQKSPDSEITDNKIDQHKIAACFCCAFLEHKAFSFDLNDGTPAKMLLSNYMLAYSVSLQVIYLCLIDFYLSAGKKEFAVELKKNATLFTPETTKSHDQYNLGRVKSLALNEYHNVAFDLLAYADMMYWIEHFNRQCLERTHIIHAIDPGNSFQD